MYACQYFSILFSLPSISHFVLRCFSAFHHLQLHLLAHDCNMTCSKFKTGAKLFLFFLSISGFFVPFFMTKTSVKILALWSLYGVCCFLFLPSLNKLAKMSYCFMVANLFSSSLFYICMHVCIRCT